MKRSTASLTLCLGLITACGSKYAGPRTSPPPVTDTEDRPAVEKRQDTSEHPKHEPNPKPQDEAVSLEPTQPVPAAAATEYRIPQRPLAHDEYAGWTTHRIGAASFRHPDGWRVVPDPGGLMLIPNEQGGPSERISILARPAPGVREALDRRVAQTLDEMVRGAMPGLRRAKSPVAVPAGFGRDGARYDYAGKGPDGRAAEGSIYVAVENQQAAAITIAGDAKALHARRSTVEKIFRSFDSGQGPPGSAGKEEAELDGRLIGKFMGEAILAGESVYINSQLAYAFGGDGVVLFGSSSHLNASQGDGKGGFEWTATGSTGDTQGDLERGHWSTLNGVLTIRWDSGKISTVAYSFEPHGSLATRHPVTKKLLMFYSRTL